MTHNELAARIERAEGPDIALDCEVAIALGLAPEGYERAVVWGEPRPYWWVRSDPKADYWAVPAYTASIDAAMQLVPEGMYWDLSGPTCAAVYGKDAGKYTAQCGSFPQDGFIIIRLAATPALALCAAAIRARSASDVSR